jgi:hypothetical protein
MQKTCDNSNGRSTPERTYIWRIAINGVAVDVLRASPSAVGKSYAEIFDYSSVNVPRTDYIIHALDNIEIDIHLPSSRD